MPPLVTACVTDAPRKCYRDGADDFLRSEYGSGMKILHESCVITCLDQDDPWRTERRSDGWNVGDVLPSESDTQQHAGDSCRRERPRNDWNIGSAFPDETDSVQLALVPVESPKQLGGRDPRVFSHQRVAELLLSDDGPARADRVAEQDADRRALV